MSTKYINSDGVLSFFKKCSICGVLIMCTFNKRPEEHKKKCLGEYTKVFYQDFKESINNLPTKSIVEETTNLKLLKLRKIKLGV